MGIANVGGRVTLLVAGEAVDVHAASDGRTSAHPQNTYELVARLRALATATHLKSSNRDARTDFHTKDPVDRPCGLDDETSRQG